MTPPPGLVACPAGDRIYTRAAVSLMRLGQGVPPGSSFSLRSQGTTIAQKRNALVREFLASERLAWVLFVDSDMVLPADTVPRLLDHGLPLVGGLYFQRATDHPPEAWHVPTRGDDPLRRTDVDGLRLRSLNLSDLEPGQTLAEVDAVGAGCLLVRREVLEAVGDPWFVASREKDAGVNEDLNFCLRAREAGFGVHVDVTLQTEHLGVVGIDRQYAETYWEAHVPVEKRSASAPEPAKTGGRP